MNQNKLTNTFMMILKIYDDHLFLILKHSAADFSLVADLNGPPRKIYPQQFNQNNLTTPPDTINTITADHDYILLCLIIRSNHWYSGREYVFSQQDLQTFGVILKKPQ